VTALRVSPEIAHIANEAADVLATSLPAGQVAVPKLLVDQELSLRQWREPLTTDQMAALAQSLGAETFVRGAIIATSTRGQSNLKIEAAIELVNASDRSVVGGAVADRIAVKLPRDRDASADRAVRTALLDLVAQSAPRLARASLATGRVLVVEQTGDVHLNVGSRQGVHRGTRLTVTRRQIDKDTNIATFTRVGEIAVRSTGENSAIARSTSRDFSMQPLDVVTVIMELKTSKALRELLNE
jgi:hypothetical protein